MEKKEILDTLPKNETNLPEIAPLPTFQMKKIKGGSGPIGGDKRKKPTGY